MAEYKVFLRYSVTNDLDHIPKRDLNRIIERIESLSHDPRPPGHEKLCGEEHYRIRQGKYRIVYSIQDQELTVWIVKVGQRRDVYRKLT